MFDGATFTINMTTLRDPNLICAQVLTPFEQTIPLDVAGLPAGRYRVVVNGVTAQFDTTKNSTMTKQ
jgi:inhibitor of cysteine peptidase